jgi:hypothetical protein
MLCNSLLTREQSLGSCAMRWAGLNHIVLDWIGWQVEELARRRAEIARIRSGAAL